MSLILDSDVLLLDERVLANRLPAFGGYGGVYVSAVSMAELLTCARLARSVDGSIRRSAYVEALLSSLPVQAFDTAAARVYAEICQHFMQASPDAAPAVHRWQIAATAIVGGHLLLSCAPECYEGVPGLEVKSFL